MNNCHLLPAVLSHTTSNPRTTLTSSHPYRAHKLVEEYPDSALAWFGVGCYYMAARQYEQSRCFFAKATQLDKHHAYAWICFGHAFAEQVRGEGSGWGG